MKFRFIWPGKTKDEHLRALVQEYLKRLQRFVRCELIEIREVPGSVEKESARLVEALSGSNLTILLAVDGREWNSHELAAEVRRWENDSVKEIAVVIGGPNGVSADIADRAQVQWRLSRLTLTHEMARVLVLEQLYRAYTINRGIPYQK